MGSLIGKALSVRNAGTPVPIGVGAKPSSLNLMALGSQSESYMRAHGSVGTVWQIVHLLSSNVAKPEWRLYRKQHRDGRVRYTTQDQGSDQRTEVLKHQALTVLNQPATLTINKRPITFWSRFTLFETSQLYMELAGEWFWVVDYDKRASFPVGVWPIRPDRIEPVPDPETFLAGWIYTPPDGSERIPLMPHEVIQCKYPNPLDPYRGLGPVQAVLVDIDAARYSAEWNRNYFLNSAEPGGIIQVDHKVEDDEWNELVNRWREAHRGVARAHRIAVLEAGQTWVPNQHSLRDMDFANLRNVSRDVIREAFGIHKIMLGNSDDVNRANAQTGEEVFANWSVAPRLDRWREALNTQFLPLFGAAGADVEFDYIYPLPQNREQDNAELAAKTTAAQVLVTAGYDPHDVLEVVGLPDMAYAALTAAPPDEDVSPGALLPEESEDQVGGDSAGNHLRLRPANAAKVSKTSVHYREATTDHECGNCAMFHPATGSCDLVTGQIAASATCDEWTPSAMEARLRKVLSNGRVPVLTGGSGG